MKYEAVKMTPKLDIAALKRLGEWWEQFQKTQRAPLSTESQEKRPKTA